MVQVPAETVEEEIRQHQHRIQVLTIVRNHVLRGEIYPIGKKDLEFGELLPDPPPEPDTRFTEHVRWVNHPVDVSAALGGSCCPATEASGGRDDRRTETDDDRRGAPEPAG